MTKEKQELASKCDDEKKAVKRDKTTEM